MSLVEVKVPDIGDFKDVDVIEVNIKPGDVIENEQALMTLESDKASIEVPSDTAGTALLSILITPAGDGTVSVSSPGQSTVTCTQNCTLSFPIGTGPITLTAAPNSSFSFVGYSNCQTQSGLQCTINTLDVDTTVTASFQ